MSLDSEAPQEYFEEPQRDAIHRIPELELAGRGRKTALLVVNVQNCFFRGGAMAMFPSEKTSEDIEKEKMIADLEKCLLQDSDQKEF